MQALRKRLIYQRLPMRHLVRFMEPVALRDLPGKAEGGFHGPRWALFAAVEEVVHGTIHSPGHGILWQCTDKGLAMCVDYLAALDTSVTA